MNKTAFTLTDRRDFGGFFDATVRRNGERIGYVAAAHPGRESTWKLVFEDTHENRLFTAEMADRPTFQGFERRLAEVYAGIEPPRSETGRTAYLPANFDPLDPEQTDALLHSPLWAHPVGITDTVDLLGAAREVKEMLADHADLLAASETGQEIARRWRVFVKKADRELAARAEIVATGGEGLGDYIVRVVHAVEMTTATLEYEWLETMFPQLPERLIDLTVDMLVSDGRVEAEDVFIMSRERAAQTYPAPIEREIV